MKVLMSGVLQPGTVSSGWVDVSTVNVSLTVSAAVAGAE